MNKTEKSKVFKEIPSPCIQICTMDSDSGLCIGCSRTEEEITNWFMMTPEEQIEIIKQLDKR